MISFHNNCVGYRLIFWCFVRPKRKSTPWKRRRVKLLKKPGRALSIQRPLLLLLLHSSIPPLDLVAADLSLLESTLTFCLLNFDQTFCGWLSSCLLCLLTSFFYNVAKLRCLAIISQLCASYSCRVGHGLPASSQDCSVVKEVVSRLCMQKAHRDGDCREIRKQSRLCRLLRTPLALSHPIIYCGGGRDGLG